MYGADIISYQFQSVSAFLVIAVALLKWFGFELFNRRHWFKPATEPLISFLTLFVKKITKYSTK